MPYDVALAAVARGDATNMELKYHYYKCVSRTRTRPKQCSMQIRLPYTAAVQDSCSPSHGFWRFGFQEVLRVGLSAWIQAISPRRACHRLTNGVRSADG